MKIVGAAAKVSSNGKVTRLNVRVEPDDIVTAEVATDGPKLARLLTRILATAAELKRRFAPRHVDFEDVVCGASGAIVQLHHGFNGRVRWWVVDWQYTGSASAPLLVRSDATTNANSLALASRATGTATIRVQESG